MIAQKLKYYRLMQRITQRDLEADLLKFNELVTEYETKLRSK